MPMLLYGGAHGERHVRIKHTGISATKREVLRLRDFQDTHEPLHIRHQYTLKAALPHYEPFFTLLPYEQVHRAGFLSVAGQNLLLRIGEAEGDEPTLKRFPCRCHRKVYRLTFLSTRPCVYHLFATLKPDKEGLMPAYSWRWTGIEPGPVRLLKGPGPDIRHHWIVRKSVHSS